jgi:hypothetical protein
LFTVPEIKPNRDIVGIRKGEATSNSKMLSFYGSEDSFPIYGFPTDMSRSFGM